MKAFFSPLMRELALIISVLILSVEMILLFTSISHENEELNSLRELISNEVKEKTGKSLNELDVKTLSSNDIEERLRNYSTNIISLTLLITVIVSLGTMFIFYRKAGRHIVHLNHANMKRKDGIATNRYNPSTIPANEIGDLITSRNLMLDEIDAYEMNLQEKLDEAENKLIQSAKLSLVGEFTAGIIHDIRNPLTVILSYTQILENPEKRQKLSEEKLTKNISKIHLAAKKLYGLVDRMGRFNHQKIEFKENVDLKVVLENSLLFTESKGKKVGAIVSKVFPDEQAYVFGDEGGLEQAFSNLLSNAFDALEGQETKIVTIAIEDSDNSYVVHINDTGKGMEPHIRDSVFKSFFTTKEKGKGTGLGLSNVQETILGHGGEIILESEPNKGTTFSLVIYKKDSRPESLESKIQRDVA